MTAAGPDPTEAHQRMADWFERQSGTCICNPYDDRPAMLRLLGDVAGGDVLDAGCGPGFDAAVLALVLHHVDDRAGLLRRP